MLSVTVILHFSGVGSVSLVGNGIFLVALLVEISRLTGNPVDLALVVSARTISTIILLLFGRTLADRFSRRLVMLISDMEAYSGRPVEVQANYS